MRSLQDYRDIYREIADNLGLVGDSVEMLVQMLSQASYISEVENASYVQESSLEKATLMNSKIQRCMDEMYSVFRGSCPRVIMKFRPSKYFSWNVFDEIVSSNNFKIYYLGYLDKNKEIRNLDYTERVAIEEGFIYAPITIPPVVDDADDTTYTVIGLLASKKAEETWVLDSTNTYYVDALEENLSNDMWVKINGDYVQTTRNFSDHILESSVFDLTIPDWGSRLYVADIFKKSLDNDEYPTPSNTKVEATYFKYSNLDSYNESELKKISIKGAELMSHSNVWLVERGYEELSKGIVVLGEKERDSVTNVHYRANRDRYVNSVLRSNSDIGRVLEEMYPSKVKPGGTSYKFIQSVDGGSNILDIAYVPSSSMNLLSTSEIEDFIDTRKAYYITDTITVHKGYQYTAIFKIDLELYTSEDVTGQVKSILSNYENILDLNFKEKEAEIRSLVSKISNVKQISDLNITYVGEDGTLVDEDKVINSDNKWRTYFKVTYVINSTVQNKA